MTHNTREVEELKNLAKLIEKETYLLASDKQRGLTGTQHAVAKDNLSRQFNEKLESLSQTLHQQLQKVETQAYRRGYKQGRFDNEMDVLRDVPLPNHSELDQDNK